MRWVGTVAGSIAAVLALASVATAQDGAPPTDATSADATPVVRVSTGDRCEGAIVGTELERLLGRALRADDGLVTVVVEGESTTLTVHITYERGGEARERRLVGDDCAALLRASALVVALAIDPELVIAVEPEPTPPAPPAAPPRPPAHDPADELADPRAHEPAPTSGPWFVAAAEGGVLVGALPEPAVAGRIRLGATIGQFEVSASFEARGPAIARSPTRLDLGGTFGLFAGRLTIGAVFPFDVLRIVPFLAFEGGGMVGAGFGTERDRTGWGEWMAQVVGLEARLCPWPFLCASVGAELLLPLLRATFVIDRHEPERVFSPSDAAGLFTIGLDLRVP